jgi:hypothetical protein
MVSAARNAMYAAKSFKDTIQDLQEFADSGKDLKFRTYQSAKKQVTAFADRLDLLLFEPGNSKASALMESYRQVQQQYHDNISLIYTSMVDHPLPELDISSVLNLNRELTTALKSLTISAHDLLLKEEERSMFDELPGFIR